MGGTSTVRAALAIVVMSAFASGSGSANAASAPLNDPKAFPASVFNMPGGLSGVGYLQLPPTPAPPQPKSKVVAAPKPKRRVATKAVPKTTKRPAKTTRSKSKGAASMATTTTLAPELVPADPVFESSGQCGGIEGKRLARSVGVSVNQVTNDPVGWCQLLSDDAQRLLRFDPVSRLDWPSLRPNAYFGEPVNVARSSLLHAAGKNEWSEVAVLASGGIFFVVSSLQGREDALALAALAVSLLAPADPVAGSAGACRGPLTSAALAQFTAQFFRYDASLEGGGRCLLVSENGLVQVSIARLDLESDGGLLVNQYWTEYEPGIGRSAVYHAPSGPGDLHGIGFLVGRTDLDVFTTSRAEARALASKVAGLFPAGG